MAHQSKGFTWTQTSCTVKTKSHYQSLVQTVTPNQGPVCLKIDMEREFQINNDLGWNWHKSWNIPNISVKLTLKNDEYTQWMNCLVQLKAVKELQADLFEEVGLDGTTIYELIDGKAFFTGVKFNSTTYNHQGHKFQLFLIIKERENIILSLQSPPIFVDSRRSARDEHRQIQYIQPFEPQYLERNFCKKEKCQNDIIDAPIENNENGLYNYLTAPNIRNKIKHPLFLALKFSRCFNIYFMTNFEVENHFVELQKQLLSKSQISQYLLVFQSNNKRIKRKIEDSLNQLFGQSKIQVVEKKHLNELTHHKLEFSAEDYKESYNQLIFLMNQFTLQQNSEFHSQNPQQVQKQTIEIEPQSQSLIKLPFDLDRKSAFTKYKDFDKLPTKNFEDEKLEQQQRQEKLNNIREIEKYEKIQKIIKIEDNNNNQLEQQQLSQQSQIASNYYINQYNGINSNFSMLFQQQLQQQLLQFYMIQQQLLFLQMPSSV